MKNLDPFGGDTDKVKMNPPRMSPDLLEPAGPTDPRVTVLSVRAADDKPLALFANYSLHYVGDLPALSADYFGVFANTVAGKLKAGQRVRRHPLERYQRRREQHQLQSERR